MKKYLLFWLLSSPGLAHAQLATPLSERQQYAQAYKPRTWLVGGQAGYSPGVVLDNTVTAQVYGGYFVANKLMVGLSASRSQEGFTSVRDITYLLGPVVRYQLTRTRFSPFVVASYQLGQRTVTRTESRTTSQTILTSSGPVLGKEEVISRRVDLAEMLYSRSLGVGLSMGLTPLLKVDLVLHWQDRVSTASSGIQFDDVLYQPQLGVNYLLGAKRGGVSRLR